MKTKFQERVRKLIDVDAPNLCNTFKNSMMQACDKVCGKKNGRRIHGDTWWWKEELKEATRQKKAAYEKMCKNRSEKNKAKYQKSTKKEVANSMRKETKRELKKLNKKPNNIFSLVKFIKKDGKDIEGGRCMRGKDPRIGFSEKDKKRIWKNHMKEIMIKANDWDHVTAASMV